MAFLSPDHFLSLPRPDLTFGQPVGVPDTSTLAAHDFDVDTRTGFLPPQPPISRLPADWEPWEAALNDALERKIQLGDRAGLSSAETISSASWRTSVSHVSRCIILNLQRFLIIINSSQL
jgi:indoleamine 2,3-dioxygenase